MKCKIQWIDENGKSTQDTNDAIGYAWIEAYYEQPNRTLPNGYKHEESDHYPICSEHAKQLSAADMCHWRFEALPVPDSQLGNRKAECHSSA